ncbi:MAG: hypothetical protein WCC59_14830, partial [Terriglobales bacterium]
MVQKRTDTSRGAAKFVSPARQRWVKWTKKRERQRRGTATTQTPQGRHEERDGELNRKGRKDREGHLQI